MAFSKTFIIYGLITFTLSILFTRLMIWINIADIPGDRSSHTLVTPRSGGIAVVLSFVIVILGAYAYGTFEGIPAKPLFVAFCSSLFMAFTGLIDDIKGLSWFTRAAIQFLLALTVVKSGLSVPYISLPHYGNLELGIVGDVIAIIWILGLTNAFNFMDGINGISGGVTLIASIAFMSMIKGDPVTLFATGLIPFAILSFLIFNFPKGKIFLGDVGSQFLGFVFACLGLIVPLNNPKLSFWVGPFLFLAYIYDTLITLVRRYVRGDNIFSAHRKHLYQLLVRMGHSHAGVAILYFGLFILQGILIAFMINISPSNHIYFFVPISCLYTLGAISIIKYCKKHEIDL